MADMTSMLMQAPPDTDPVEYAKAVRRAQMAEVLQQMALTSPEVQQPSSSVGGKFVQARISPFQGLAKVAEALMARKAMDRSNTNMAQIYANGLKAFQPGGGQAMPQTDPNAPQSGYQGGPGVRDAGQAQGQPTPINPMNPQGLPAVPLMRQYMTDPNAYLNTVKGTPEWQNFMTMAHGDVNLATRLALAKAQKDRMLDLRPDQTALDPLGGAALTAPDPSKNMQYSGNGFNGTLTAAPIANAEQIAASGVAAKTAAENANKPIQGTGLNGEVTLNTPRLDGMAPSTAPLPGIGGVKNYFGSSNGQVIGHQTTAGAAEQKKGGETAAEHGANLAADAANAVDVIRGLHEMRNLSNVASPNSANQMKLAAGNLMIAGGADPDSVAGWLGVNVGALQAASKQTSQLAVSSIHQMTSRGTNFDLDTFMKNNPNLMMSPEGFHRVVDYMEKKSHDIVAKQQDWIKFIHKGDDGKPVPEEQQVGLHTAHWNKKVLDEIGKGKTDSRKPLDSFVTPE